MKAIQVYQGEVFNSKQIFNEILSVPVEGCTVQEMRQLMKIMDAVDKAEDKIELEDNQFEKLKVLFKDRKFRFVHKDLIAIEDTLGGS